MKLQLLSKIIVLERLGQILRNALQLDLAGALAVALKQTDMVLAEGQDVEPLVMGAQAKQGFDIETVRYYQ